MTPGEAFDYLRGGKNRRVFARGFTNETTHRWANAQIEIWVGNVQLSCPTFESFSQYTYEKTRDLPVAPPGTHWIEPIPGAAPSAGLLLSAEISPDHVQIHKPIISQEERDIQAARVAEFDGRPEPEEEP